MFVPVSVIYMEYSLEYTLEKLLRDPRTTPRGKESIWKCLWYEAYATHALPEEELHSSIYIKSCFRAKERLRSWNQKANSDCCRNCQLFRLQTCLEQALDRIYTYAESLAQDRCSVIDF